MTALPKYRPDKATQMAYLLLSHFKNGLDYYPLLKLMWLIEKKSFQRAGRPITYDKYVSMNQGVTLSNTYDIIKGKRDDRYWSAAFEKTGQYRINIRENSVIPNALSEFDHETILLALAEYGRIPQRQWRELAHEKPLWKGEKESNTSIELTYSEILNEVGLGEYVDDIMGDLAAAAELENASCQNSPGV